MILHHFQNGPFLNSKMEMGREKLSSTEIWILVSTVCSNLKFWSNGSDICNFDFKTLYSRGEKSWWWLKKVLTKSTFIIEEERHKGMCQPLYLLAVNKGGFGYSKNGSDFFIHCLSHFLWAFKLLIDFFTKENGQKMTAKTLDAYKKWHRQCMWNLNTFLESPKPPLLTPKRY